MSDPILRFLGEVVAYGGGAAAFAYLMFQFLGKSWIENKFTQRLEQHRHQQALEIQRLRVEIDSILSGVLKIQEKEFETLPEAWRKLDEAHGHVSALVSPVQQYPNLDGMTPARLEEFLESSELFNTQKEAVRQSENKVDTYREEIFWHRLHTVKQVCADLHNFVARNGIFFPPELKEKFSKVTEELWAAVSSKAVGHEAKDYKVQNEGWQRVKAVIDPLYKAIESDIHARLHSHGRS
ncbi:MAG: hypothetical protein HYZ50_21950 [Deltaproteobacteria bacterium]|nr:hypothetical protein [Deltaproteobacteria bacterium]